MILAAYLRGSDALVFGLVATALACIVWRVPDERMGFLPAR